MLNQLSDRTKEIFNIGQDYALKELTRDFTNWHILYGYLMSKNEFSDFLNENELHDKAKEFVSKKLSSFEKAEENEKPKVAGSVKTSLEKAETDDYSGGKQVEPQHLILAIIDTDKDIRDYLLKELNINLESLDKYISSYVDFSEEMKKTPNLNKYARDLTDLARRGKLPVIVGREKEMMALMEILCRERKNNPVLIGAAGVGKTAIVEGFAQLMACDEVPKILSGKRIVELSLSALRAGAKYIGDFEKRLQTVLNDIKKADNIILFIDEVHALIGSGGTAGLQDAATILKPALARGDLHCIGATTHHEYRKYMEKDAALERRFQVIRVDEPKREVVIEILKNISVGIKERLNVEVSNAILNRVYELADSFMKNHFFPDKAIDLLERSATRTLINSEKDGNRVVNENTILQVLTQITGLPLESLQTRDTEWGERLCDFLNDNLMGQKEAIEKITSTLSLVKKRLDLNPARPDGVFLCVGPENSGKDSLPNLLAQFFFEDWDRVVRIDMSEYSAEFTVSRLIGSPPGYVGYDEEGQLTGPISLRPYSVVHLSNVDAAHPVVLRLFNQVFDDGRLTDGSGRTVYFSDVTFIITMDLEVSKEDTRTLGFGGIQEDRETEIMDVIDERLTKVLPPDFISGVDEVIYFKSIDISQNQAILKTILDERVKVQMAKRGIDIKFNQSVYTYIMEKQKKISDVTRKSIERLIEDEILEPLAKDVDLPDDGSRVEVEVSIVDGNIAFNKRNR